MQFAFCTTIHERFRAKHRSASRNCLLPHAVDIRAQRALHVTPLSGHTTDRNVSRPTVLVTKTSTIRACTLAHNRESGGIRQHACDRAE